MSTAPLVDTARRRLAYGAHAAQYVDLIGDVDTQACALLVHGGFWRAEKDSESLWPAVRELAPLLGCAGSVEYRTADAGGVWPRCQQDVVAAVRAVWASGVAPAATVLVGHSAGGHLALTAAAELPGLGAVVALSAVGDLVAAYTEHLGDDAVTVLFGGEPAEEQLRAASPLHRPPPDCRIELVHAGSDQAVPASQSRTLYRRYAESGANVGLFEIADARHMHLVNPERPAWPAVLARIAGRPA